MEFRYKLHFTSAGDMRGPGDGVGAVTVTAPTPFPEPFNADDHEKTRAYLTSQGYQGVRITWREPVCRCLWRPGAGRAVQGTGRAPDAEEDEMGWFSGKPKSGASGGTFSPKEAKDVTVSREAVAAITKAGNAHADALREVRWARYEGHSPATIARLEQEAHRLVVEANRIATRRR